MPWPLVIVMLALLALAAGCAVYWWTAAWRMAATMRMLPTARDGLSLPGADLSRTDFPRVCILIPAHNEQENITRCARSLAAQEYPNLRVVFALDRCADATAERINEVMRESERAAALFEIVEITSCPDDWSGKTHAAQRAVRESRGAAEADLLLFADADTSLHPACTRAAVALLEERKVDLLSLLSTLTTKRWYERVAQPVAALELVRQYPLLSANRAEQPRAWANGQFMLFRREAYDAIGGHESVKHALLEDIALARVVKRAGLRPGILLADGMVSCAMYRSWPEFRRGWKRIYTEAANRRGPRLRRFGGRMFLVHTAMPIASVAAIVVGARHVAEHDAHPLAISTLVAGVLGAGGYVLVMGAMALLQRHPLWTLPLLPVGGALVAAILREAGDDLKKGRGAEWGGRVYQMRDRGSGSAPKTQEGPLVTRG